ncbi:glutaredoxin [Acanthocystis turfacea Chlorella virus WI0606]|nr:glutaredoxin [Acanthocystis turfacea Chlorella virus WI0606]
MEPQGPRKARGSGEKIRNMTTRSSTLLYNHIKMLTIFEKPGCPHCKRARNCLRKKKIAFSTVRCKDVDELKEKIKGKGLRVPRTLTFPRVFDGEKLIGGADQVEKKFA